jgi:HEAT repeat protein/energy-coupling factor transporter ATP-binding protein EcfA2
MPNPDELIAIVDRILNGSRDESEVAQLRQWLQVSDTTLQCVSQDGKFNTNIGQVLQGEIHIGDRHYQFDVEALRELLQPTTPVPNIDWQAVSQAMLEEQLRLTTNPLTSGEGISYRTEQVYVPLGLVERKRQTQRREDVPPEQGSLLYEETEITQRFEHEQFLEQVLQQGQSPKSGGKRIAIIGEPGAGKTTLLQQIAQWVSEQVEGAIAIWVSLADLRGQELEPYLLERWLQAVARKLGQAEASLQVKDTFVAQTGQGRVWLLLDGVDEMQVSSGNPLAEMSRQVRMGGLLSQARIVLSSRLNLWDGDHNALDTFDTYRTLEFSYPQQVEQFIGHWFGELSEGQGEQAERLCTALKEPGKERIRDLVKNPLRLTLLCFNWYLGEGTLPETKAGLYEQFVADFYEWKREQFPTTVEQRRQLNAALGELAREAIDKEATRFRLRHDFVCEFLGEPDEEGSLFQLALQLGWLNKVGVDAENRRKAVYAFFHPTFQEYFAALVIEDWCFFLNHIPENPSHPDANYRIFEPQWKEIVLLWFGRTDITEKQKEVFIKFLVDFEDGSGFYSFRALALAVAVIGEFNTYSEADRLIWFSIVFAFGYSLQQEQWLTYPEPIKQLFKNVLQETDRKKVCQQLMSILISNFENNDIKDDLMCFSMTELLGNLKPGDSLAIGTMIKLIQTSENYTVVSQAVTSLKTIAKGIPEVFQFLSSLIKTLENEAQTPILDSFLWQVANVMEEILPGNQESFRAMIRLAKTSKSAGVCWKAANSLETISKDDPEVIYSLIWLIRTAKDESTRWKAAAALGRVGKNKPEVIQALTELVETADDKSIRDQALAKLERVGRNNPKAHQDLDELVQIANNESIRYLSIENFRPGNLDPIRIVVLGTGYPAGFLIEFEQPPEEQSTPKQDTVSMKEIVMDNPQAIQILTKLEQSTEDETDKSNPEAIQALTTLVQTTKQESTRLRAAVRLGKLDRANLVALQALTGLVQITEDNSIRQQAVTSLKQITLSDKLRLVASVLKSSLTAQACEQNFNRYKDCYEVVWHCAENMTYPAFYRATHLSAIEFYQQNLEIHRLINNRQGFVDCLFAMSALYKQSGKFWKGQEYIQQAIQILQELEAPLDAYPIPEWVKSAIKLAQTGKLQLALCITLGLTALSLVWFVLWH